MFPILESNLSPKKVKKMSNKLIKVPDTENLYYKNVKINYDGKYGPREKTVKRYTLRFLNEDGKRKQEEIGDDLTIKEALKIQKNKTKFIESIKSRTKRTRRTRQKQPIISIPQQEKKFSVQTIDDLAQYYFNNNQDKKTINREKRTYEIYIKDVFGTQDAKNIKVSDVKLFYANLKVKLAIKTAGNIILMLKKYYNYAIKHHYYTGVNLVSEIEITHPDNTRTKYLTKEQIKELENDKRVLENEDIYIFVLLSTRTGSRAGSIMKATKFDVDLEKHTIKLHNFKKKVEDTKEYTAFFDDVTKKALEKRFETCETHEKIIKSTYASLRKKLQRILDDLFNYADRDNEEELDSKGRVKSYKQLLYSKKGLRSDDIVSEEDLEVRAKRRKNRIVIHSIRHSFAYNFLKQEKSSIFKLKNLLNHSDIKMTLRYAHDDEDENKEIIKNMYK